MELLNALSALLPTLRQDPAIVTALVERIVDGEEIGFGDVLGVEPRYVCGFEDFIFPFLRFWSSNWVFPTIPELYGRCLGNLALWSHVLWLDF